MSNSTTTHHHVGRVEARLDAIGQWFEKYVTPPLVKLGNQRHFAAVRAGLMRVIPIIVVGAVPLILTNLPVESWAIAMEPYDVVLNTFFQMTFGFLGLWAAMSIGAEMGRMYKLEPVMISLITACCFILTVAPVSLEEGVLPYGYFGATGLFTGIVVAIIVAEVSRFMRDHNMVIKMPAGVPANISASFGALFPLTVLLVFFWLLRYVFGFELAEGITFLVSPLLVATDTWWAAIIAILVTQLLWFVGIHGGSITIWGVLYPFILANIAMNAEAASQGEPLPHVYTEPFNYMYGMIGGVGNTLPLAFLCLLFARSVRLKQVGRLSVGPGIFNINEPVMFGTPIVMNPIMFIPFTFGTSVLGYAIGYAATAWGWVSASYIQTPWTTPPFINAYLSTGGDWRAVILQAIIIVLMTAIWFIFFRIWDRRVVAEENAAELGTGTTTVVTPEPAKETSLDAA